jgi:hypothetical protein
LILDGNQNTLRHLDWLNNVFEEPYIREFAAGSVDAWMSAAGFEAVETQDLWLIHQVNRGVKPLGKGLGVRDQESGENAFPDESWIPAPGY